jgi:hypothetical protein
MVLKVFLGLNQLVCRLLGHDEVLRFEDSRILLHCVSCGYDSPGWDVGNRRTRAPSGRRPQYGRAAG